MLNLQNKSIYSRLLALLIAISICLGNIPVFAENVPIKDINKSSGYARKSIIELSDKKIITGDSDGKFNPDKTITRAEMTAIMARLLKLDITDLPDRATFKDVPKTHWAFPYVEAAYKIGIITGISQDTFGVNDLCTREQMTAIFVRALGVSEKDIYAAYGSKKTNKLADKNSISGWSKGYVELALSTGLVTGTSSTVFSPLEFAKREQTAVVADRYLNKQELIKVSLSKADELTLKQIAALEKSVVLINTSDKTGLPFMQGSGFCIAPGLFLTNYHVLEGASTYKITDSTDKEHEIQGIVKYDKDLDLAIIKTKSPVNIQPLKIGSKSTVVKGDKIAAIGSPQGFQNSISEGVVVDLESIEYGNNNKIDIIEATAAISQGSSGGPLFNMKGYVIGVTSAMSEDGTQKFSVAIDHVKNWIKELAPKAFKDIKTLNMQKSMDEYWEFENEEIRKTINKALESMEKKDLEGYMSTIHKLSPSYNTIKETYGKLFSVYDFDFNIKQINFTSVSLDAAEVNVTYTVKRSGKKETATLDGGGQYFLMPYKGEWKIYNSWESAYVQEGSGSMTDKDLEVEMPEKAPPSDLIMKTAPLSFSITDSVAHPGKPVIYATDMTAKKVVAYNYETKTSIERSLTLPPESIAIAGDEVYVALLKGQHDYWKQGDFKGSIAILDANTLQLKEQFDINIDPFDIVVDREGFIYAFPGSGQHSDMVVYSRKTLQPTDSKSMYTQSYAVMHPTINRIYTTNTAHTPRGMARYNVSQGKFVFPEPILPIEWPYHGDYAMGTNFKISPDGKLLFNGLGSIFITTTNNVVGDLTYYDSLRKGFTDIAFDLANNRFFTGTKDGTIYEYDYSTLKIVRTHKVQGEILYLNYKDNKLAAFTKVGNKYYCETAAVN